MTRPSRWALAVSGALALAGSAGFLSAKALGTTLTPARTVTINVGTGAQGPKGDPGPQGPKGDTGPRGPAGLECPSGYSAGKLVINHPGGQVALWTCLAD